ncbi:MAG: glutathione synthase [Gammaproteobacteria bacterium]|nr:MAG: glutathione synthase [Gammaproteobacteria bacterium]TND05314.1 MAG: glutathione synthase [Gammaproteobacteria bacterium]
MTIRLGVVMDPIASIKPKKDSTLAMLLAAQRRGWSLYYMEQGDLFLRDGRAGARARQVEVFDDLGRWHHFHDAADIALDSLDVILMRKDPPFNIEYIYTTQILELAETAGVLVVNKPQTLRDANEKLATAWFPQCTAPTLVTRDARRLRDFLLEHEDVILKPLDTMGGHSIFRLRPGDPNISVVIETITHYGTQLVMAQRYIREIVDGDKRILLIDGEPVPFMLARVPQAGETRGNLAAGGTGIGRLLGERDRWICAQVGPLLRQKGLMFVGLDVIGDYLTEINITSPTCIRELDKLHGLDIAGQLMDCIARKLAQ